MITPEILIRTGRGAQVNRAEWLICQIRKADDLMKKHTMTDKDWENYYNNHGPYDVEVERYMDNEKLCVRLKREGRQQLFLYDVDIDEAIKALFTAKKKALELRAKLERKGKIPKPA